jgi:hypothetical protein
LVNNKPGRFAGFLFITLYISGKKLMIKLFGTIFLVFLITSVSSTSSVKTENLNHRILTSNSLLAHGTIEMNYLPTDSADVYRTRIAIDPIFLGERDVEMLSFVNPVTKLPTEAFYVSRNRNYNDISEHDSVYIKEHFNSDFTINTLDHFIFNQAQRFVVDVEKDTSWAQNNLPIFDFQSALINVSQIGIMEYNIAHTELLCSVPVEENDGAYAIQFNKHCGAVSTNEGLSIKSAEIEYDAGMFPKRIKFSKNYLLSVEYLDENMN